MQHSSVFRVGTLPSLSNTEFSVWGVEGVEGLSSPQSYNLGLLPYIGLEILSLARF